MPIEHLIVLDQPGSPVPKQRDHWRLYGSIVVAGEVAAEIPRLWVYGRERVAVPPGDEPDEWGGVEGPSADERDALLFQPWSAATRAELLDRIFASFQPCTAMYVSESGGETSEKRGREG